MGGIIYLLSLEEPSQPLTSVLWGLREMQRTIAASPVNHETGWGQTVHRAKRGVDGRRLFSQGNGKKRDFRGSSPSSGLCVHIYVFIQ